MRKNKPLLTELEVVDAGAEGKAVAKKDDIVVFVPYAMPGDIVDVQVNKKRRKYMEGYIVKYHKKSEKHQEPFCAHFGTCGGCKWQHMAYPDQLFYKEKQVKDNLERIGGISVDTLRPIIPSEKSIYYRNKLEFTFSDRRWIHEGEPKLEDGDPDMLGLGFHVPRFFDKIEDVKHCFLMEEPSNEIRLETRKYAVEHKIPFYNYRIREGYLRNLVIRKSTTNDWMVNLVIGDEDATQAKQLLDHLQEKFPQINSMFYTINLKVNDSLADLEATYYQGKAFMVEAMEDFTFRVGPMSFYQTNPEQAYKLYCQARAMADLQGDELVYDLYTGTGTIALFMAPKAKKVIGVEYVEEAVAAAKENAERNNIDNVEFLAGDMSKVFNHDFVNRYGAPDVVVTDPPRAGMHPDVVKQLLGLKPEKIVYVSCNPATQARDVSLMKDFYDVKAIQPVDMFPQTHHVENIMLLHRKK